MVQIQTVVCCDIQERTQERTVVPPSITCNISVPSGFVPASRVMRHEHKVRVCGTECVTGDVAGFLHSLSAKCIATPDLLRTMRDAKNYRSLYTFRA